ncbi:unnamed protein product [Rotaria socialis]|uniref:Uncharacterized protein n=1 Tax=Rotaria socialis TaxID=392032 RepID=A0A820Z056_9BILA|nr:unnamed protein product [Rotaria socialis]
MTNLNKFTFSIQTLVCRYTTKINVSSNKDIQRSGIGRGYQQVSSYVNIHLSMFKAKCHIYSLPCQFEYLPDVNISFPGDLLFLEILHIRNDKQQKDKHYSSTTLITFHLTLLDPKFTNVDYAKQFLFEKITHLPRLLNNIHLEQPIEDIIITLSIVLRATQNTELNTVPLQKPTAYV